MLRRFVLAIVLCALTMVPRAFAQDAPPAAPAAPPVNKADVDTLVQQGLDTLAAEDYAAARDLFEDVLILDRENATGLRGAAMAHVYLKNYPRARELLEKPTVLRGLPAKGTPDRNLVINLASVWLTDVPMRGATYARDYLYPRQRDKNLDEPMLNILGSCLNAAWFNSRSLMKYQDAEKFYVTYNDRLEAAKPGFRRWGSKWFPESEVENNLTQVVNNKPFADAWFKQLDERNKEIAAKKRQIQQNASSVDPKLLEGKLQRELNQLIENYKTFSADVQKKLIGTHGTDFPTTIDPVPLFGFEIVGSSVKPPTDANSPPVVKAQKRAVRYGAAVAVTSEFIITPLGVVANNPQTINVRTRAGKTCKASMVARSDRLNLAVLRVKDFPMPFLTPAESVAAGEVQAVGYPTPSPSNPQSQLMTGSTQKPAEDWRVRFIKSTRLPGCPVLQGGKLVAISIPDRDSDPRKLPVITLDQLKTFLSDQMISPTGAAASDPLDATVQLQCVKDIRE